MDKFEGFYKETLDFLIEITFNNNKEWFHAHKDEYIKYVKQPIHLMANELFGKMQKMDKNFTAIPKVSRINRDTRFSKDKSPYKNAIWFFFREDQSPGIRHEKPSYFFDVMSSGYRYGFSYAAEKAVGMKKMRDKMDANPAEIQRHVDWFKKQKGFTLEGDKYKRNISKDVNDDIADWRQRKELYFVKNCEIDDLFFKPELVDEVFKSYKKFYDLHNYFLDI